MDGSGIKQTRQPETPVRHLTQKMFDTRPQRPHISVRMNEKNYLRMRVMWHLTASIRTG